MEQVDNLELLDNLIFGRVTPHIYAFRTGTIPNYLKVGDTYRPVSVRLKEWEEKFPDLIKNMSIKQQFRIMYIFVIMLYMII